MYFSSQYSSHAKPKSVPQAVTILPPISKVSLTSSTSKSPQDITKRKTKRKKGEMSSTDIILNRASVALARSQRLVASWLPPQTTEEQSSNAKSEEELQREEDEIFTAVPETYISPPHSYQNECNVLMQRV